MRTFIDIHILQTLPPSNPNRDDAGSPKQAMYGGVRRARVSSQAWKRATRKAFTEHVQPTELGTRTRRVTGLIADRLMARGMAQDDAGRVAAALSEDLGIKSGKKDAESAYLLFFGRPQLERLLDGLGDLSLLAGLDSPAVKQAVAGVSMQTALGEGHPIDVALFGRMVAEIPSLNVDAAAQVAHAVSTHAVETEFDYFTAVDDEQDEHETGAGMIGTVEFSSATLYRYATVGLHQLLDNLGGDETATVDALRTFLIAFTNSMPTGHQNAFAHRTAPNLVSVVVRGDQPVNLVSAFEAPVHTSRDGLVGVSTQRLDEEMRTAAEYWGLAPLVVASTYRAEKEFAALGPTIPFAQVVERVMAVARDRIAGNGQ